MKHPPSCVVLAYGPERMYRPLVAALIEDGIPADKIAIVHNPLTPADPPLAEPGVVLRMDRNRGYAGGMNRGIQHQLANGARQILLLTDDVRLQPGALTPLFDFAQAEPRYGILGPAQPDGPLFNYGGLLDRNGRPSVRRELSDPHRGRPVIDADWVEGSAVLIRREVFEQVGLLEERFFMYFEEADLCLRAARSGWQIGIVWAALINQKARGSQARPVLYSYLMARNGLEYARRVAGWRGLVFGLGRAFRESWELLKVWYRPRSSPEQRRLARVTLLASWWGTAAFAFGRWGAPPAVIHGELRRGRTR
jgi:GT2 family glycosyltransferase